MNIINSIFTEETEVKKSKFISFLVPINEFKSLREELKSKHPKANHIVYAYRELNEFNQVVENSSDDGEPKGAAGVPTLNHLRGKELINCAIITVRYFGGIKLGVGGMVRAYGLAAKNVIDKAEITPYEKLIEESIMATYKQQRQIEYYLKECDIEPIERVFLNDKVVWKVLVSQQKLQRLKKLMV